MREAGTLGGLIWIIVIAAGIVAIFVPFFVLRIRNEVVELNRKMERLIEAVGGQRKKSMAESVVDRFQDSSEKIRCQNCNTKNLPTDQNCTNCGDVIS